MQTCTEKKKKRLTKKRGEGVQEGRVLKKKYSRMQGKVDRGTEETEEKGRIKKWTRVHRGQEVGMTREMVRSQGEKILIQEEKRMQKKENNGKLCEYWKES